MYLQSFSIKWTSFNSLIHFSPSLKLVHFCHFRFRCYKFRKCLAKTVLLLLLLSKLYSSTIDRIMSESDGALSIHIDFYFAPWKASNWCALAKRRVGITLISFNIFIADIFCSFLCYEKFLDEYLCFHLFITPHADTT